MAVTETRDSDGRVERRGVIGRGQIPNFYERFYVNAGTNELLAATLPVQWDMSTRRVLKHVIKIYGASTECALTMR